MTREEQSERPAVMRYARAFAALYAAAVWPYALFALVGATEALWFVPAFMLIASAPVVAMAFVPRRPFLGQLMLLFGALTLGFFGLGLPMAIYIGAALVDERVRAWFNGEPLLPGVARGATLGVAISAVYGLVVGAFHTIGLVFFVTTVGPELGEISAETGPVVDGGATVNRIENLLDSPTGEPRLVLVNEAHTGRPSFETAAIPTRVMAATSIDGEAWRLGPSAVPTGVFVWATWCPDCDRQLADLPEPSVMNVVLAATDCETDGVDNRRAVRAKLTKNRVPKHAKVVCMDVDDLPNEIRWYPSAFIADAKGRVRVYYEGGLSSQESSMIAEAISESGRP